MHPIRLPASAVCIALLLGACVSPRENVVFVTKASVGIDVETATPGASFAYDRIEGYYAPRYANKEVAPVYASFSTNGEMINRKIKQVYATGEAAQRVSRPLPTGTPPTMLNAHFRNVAFTPADQAQTELANGTKPPPDSEPAKAMFFGTGTVIGFKLAFTPTAIDSFTLGFKRKEMSIIPEDKDSKLIPSVLASFDSDLSAGTAVSTNLSIKQFFATGTAAEALAVDPQIHREFQTNAQAMLAEYREDERQQNRFALASLACLAELDDAKAARVWQNVQELKLFDPEGIARISAALTAGEKRAVYAHLMKFPNAASKTQTGLMHGHEAYVCDLTKKT